MKNMTINRAKTAKGFTLIEVMIAIAIVGMLALGLKQLYKSKTDDGKVSAIKVMVNTVAEGARNYKPYTGQYTGLSMTELQNLGLIPEKYLDGTGVTIFGGNITVAANAANPTEFVITLTNILNPKVGARLVRDYEQILATTPSFAGSTLTLPFSG